MIETILLWLLVNTWLSLIIAQVFKVSIKTWVDLLELVIMSIVSPIPFLLVRLINYLIRSITK